MHTTNAIRKIKKNKVGAFLLKKNWNNDKFAASCLSCGAKLSL